MKTIKILSFIIPLIGLFLSAYVLIKSKEPEIEIVSYAILISMAQGIELGLIFGFFL